MIRFLKSGLGVVAAFLLCGCRQSSENVIVPAIVHQVQQPVQKRPDMIGAVEPVYFLPMKSAFNARIDTGAVTSSIDAEDIREFERDGEKWVSFKVINRRSGESFVFERPILKSVTIRRAEASENRIKVLLPVSFGGKRFSEEFTLADRSKFDYQALIGRNILTGRYVVDTSLSHTLK